MEAGRAREQILMAAGELFGRQGYHATSIREIAQASGILSGSLYAHIRSKEDLLYDIVHGVGVAFVHGMDDILEATDTPFEKLQEGLRLHIGIVANQPLMTTVYYNDWRMLSDVRRTRIRYLRDTYEAQWRTVVKDCVSETGYPSIDDQAITLVILSSLHGVYQWYRPGTQLTTEDLADKFYQVIVSRIRVSEPEPEDARKIGG